MNNQTVLDDVIINRLRDLGGDKFLKELIDLFIEHTPEKVKDAIAGGEEGDWKRVERAVHSIKSSAGNLGAVSLQDLAGKIEQLAEHEKGDTISELLNALQREYELVLHQLNVIRKGTTS